MTPAIAAVALASAALAAAPTGAAAPGGSPAGFTGRPFAGAGVAAGSAAGGTVCPPPGTPDGRLPADRQLLAAALTPSSSAAGSGRGVRIPVPLRSLTPATSVTGGALSLAGRAVPFAWSVPAAALPVALSGTLVLPSSSPATIRVTVRNPGPTAASYDLFVASTAIIADHAAPVSSWANSARTLELAPGAVGVLVSGANSTVAFSSCPCPAGAAGDLLWFGIGSREGVTAPAYQVLDVEAVF